MELYRATGSGIGNLISADEFTPIPLIESINWRPPAESTRTVISSSNDRLLIFADSMSSSKSWYANDIPSPNPTTGPQVRYYDDGHGPASYRLHIREYWRFLENTYDRLMGGVHKTIIYTKEQGVSTTDSETISAELGVDAGSLSAKISASFTHSVTVNYDKSESKTYDVPAARPGMTRIVVGWQLCHELVALDQSGKLIPDTTDSSSHRNGTIWAGGIFPATADVYLSYQVTRQVFPSEMIIFSIKDFPDA